MPALHPERVQSLRAELGAGSRPVFVAGSIREGEEPDVMKTVAVACRKFPVCFVSRPPVIKDASSALRNSLSALIFHGC